MAVELGVMEKRGSYYYYGDEDDYLAQGRENTKEFLRENPDIAAEIKAAVREIMAPEAESSAPLSEDDDDGPAD
jgi:recombination protein RecA